MSSLSNETRLRGAPGLTIPPSLPSLPAHGCALAKDVLVHGRIFVSKEKIYFKSNILGFKTLVDFPLSSVVSIEPKMTALVIPNAIEIVVQSGETVSSTVEPDHHPVQKRDQG